MDFDHRQFDQVCRRALYRRVDRFSLRTSAKVMILIVQIRQFAYAPEERSHYPILLASLLRQLLHITAHTFVSFVVIFYRLFSLAPADTHILRETESAHAIGNAEIRRLCQSPLRLQLCLGRRPKDLARSFRVYILTLLKRLGHYRISRDVRKQPQFYLRVVRR